MNLSEAKALGLKKSNRNRVGRGIGSGNGKTSGRGHKGAKARSGWSRRVGWEGGQMPLFRRLPKRGFKNAFRKVYTTVNLRDLAVFEDGSVVDLAAVLERGLTSKVKHTELFKILGDGDISKRLTVRVDAITGPARAKIEAAGGTVDVVESREMRPKFVRKDGSKSLPGGIRDGKGKESGEA